MSSPGPGDLWEFARHLRPTQVVRRLALAAKRRMLEKVRGSRPPAARWRARLRADAPGPLFAPTAGCEPLGSGRFRFTFMNRAREFTLPFDWHLPELGVGNRLWKMNLHYMEFLGTLDDGDFMRLVDDWIRGNPPFHTRYWLDSWNSYTVSIRVVVWMQELAARGERLPRDFRERAADSLAQQLDYLRANLETDIGGNHLLKNVQALLWAGRAIEAPRARRCADIGAALLRRELALQVLPDGFHFERSPAYHAQVFCDLLTCHEALDPGPLKDELRARLSGMAQVVVDTTHPDGAPSLFNDGGLHYAHSQEECLREFTALTSLRVEPRRAFDFASAGYFGLRDGPVYLLADAGEIAPDFLVAHAHADTLSFELSHGAQRLIIDAGVYEYGAGPMRAYGRGTAAHNTVTLDGRDSSAVFGSFRCGRRARARVESLERGEGSLKLQASHDGYAHLPGAPRVRRSLAYASGIVDVEDRIEGGAGQLAESRLLFHPDLAVTVTPGGLRAEAAECSIELTTRMPLELVEGVYSPDMGLKLPCRQAVMRLGASPASGTFRIRIIAK